jgi:hypothetical protein
MDVVGGGATVVVCTTAVSDETAAEELLVDVSGSSADVLQPATNKTQLAATARRVWVRIFI